MTAVTQTPPTLQERAEYAHEEAIAIADADSRRRAEEALTERKNLLVLMLDRELGVEPDSLEVLADTWQVRAVVDGLTFWAENYRSGYYSERRLYVERTCARCHAPFPVLIADNHTQGLVGLGRALASSDHVHDWDCVTPRDEEGEPIVDRALPPETPEQRVKRTAMALGEARAVEQALEDGRAVEWQAAILRLMQTTNPLTEKPHSASSAEKVIELDEQYAAYRQRQREAVVATQVAYAEYEAAKAALHRSDA